MSVIKMYPKERAYSVYSSSFHGNKRILINTSQHITQLVKLLDHKRHLQDKETFKEIEKSVEHLRNAQHLINNTIEKHDVKQRAKFV